MAQSLEDVYCTLLMSDSYLPGAAVLANSLRDAGTTKKLAVLVTLESLTADTISELKLLYDYVIPVERIRNTNMANLYLMGRPDLSYAFTKIALWRQTQFRKVVYLDADVVALRALDELFDIEASFAAAPDIGWPDAFNSGVMVIKPDMEEYWSLHTMAVAGESFDGADQGLLNQYFERRPWQRLSFTYNCTPNAEYQWEPAYKHYKGDISAVHFIGKDKPWSRDRPAGHGVYGELLARWWAVHNRHLEDKERRQEASKMTSGTHPGTNAALQPPSVPTVTIDEPAPTAEPSMTDPSDLSEDIDQGLVEPTPTVEQPKFSAPSMEWDATKFEPPAESKPEAANFPSATYTFNESRQLFQAPPAYPEPPRDMWYKVPETKPKPYEAPKPIFPWEQNASRPKPTRVFAEDHVPQPIPSRAPVSASMPAAHVSEFEASPPTSHFTTTHYDSSQDKWTRAKPTRVWADDPPQFKPKSAEESWQAFSQSGANAWDSVPGIDSYVRSIMETQTRRGKVEVLQQATGTDDISSPTLSRKSRRESLRLTDFPTAVERPSLPVTPAPVRRPMFWGEERDQEGELPAAEGVPDQSEWNPEAKLDELRRSSVVEFEHLKKDPHPDPPLRPLPEHSIPGDEHGEELEVGGIVVAKSDRPATRFSTQETSTEQTSSSQHTSSSQQTARYSSSRKQAETSQRSEQSSSSRRSKRGDKIGFTMDDFGANFEKREKSADPLSSGPTFSFEQATPEREKSADPLSTGPAFSFEKDSSSREKSEDPLSSGPAFSYEKDTPLEAFPKVKGFAEHDFGGDSTNESEIRSSTSHQSWTSQGHLTATHHSIGPGHRLTSDGRIKAGELTFNIPEFGSDGTSEILSPGLSPTTTRDDASGQGDSQDSGDSQRKGEGLF